MQLPGGGGRVLEAVVFLSQGKSAWGCGLARRREMAQASGGDRVSTHWALACHRLLSPGDSARTDGLGQGRVWACPPALQNNEEMHADFIIFGTQQTPTAPPPAGRCDRGKEKPHFPCLLGGIKNTPLCRAAVRINSLSLSLSLSLSPPFHICKLSSCHTFYLIIIV